MIGFDKLNDMQKKAVLQTEGPVLILAGAGSGKTGALTVRIAHLLETGVKPWNILAITFTNKAAKEMRERVEKLVGDTARDMWISTFHSTCVRILRREIQHLDYENQFSIYDSDDQEKIMREAFKRLNMSTTDKSFSVKGAMSIISHLKEEMTSWEDYAQHVDKNDLKAVRIAKVYQTYQKMLKENNALDFDDLIYKTVLLFRQFPDVLEKYQERFRYIMVDEYQDTNHAQYVLTSLLADKYKNICVVGDDDQSIYGFRGSAPQIMLDFNKYYSDAVRIDMCINYRSTGNIVFASRAVAEENEHRYYKDITTYNSQGDTVSVYEFNSLNDEKAFLVSEIRRLIDTGIAADDIAVLSRTNVIGNMYMSRLESDGIPCCDYSVVQDIYEHWISKDILTYIRIALGSRERIDFLRIINKPLRYISRSYITQPADINALKRGYEGNEQMSKQVEKLVSDISMIRSMSPFAAVNYIRKGVGYDEYIRNYIYEHKADKEELYNVLDELAHRASQYMSLSQWLDGIAEYIRQCDKDRQNNTADGVHMLTMHGSKGLEYKIVLVMDVCEGIIPYNKAVLDEQIEEERRLFYVAMTRAKEKLYLLYPKQRYNKDTTRSRFIEELLTARYPLLRTDLHTP